MMKINVQLQRSKCYLSLTPGDVIKRVLDLVEFISEVTDGVRSLSRLLVQLLSRLPQSLDLTRLTVLDGRELVQFGFEAHDVAFFHLHLELSTHHHAEFL